MDIAARIRESLQSLGDALGRFVSEAPDQIVGALNERLSQRLADMDDGISGIARSCDHLETMILSIPERRDEPDLPEILNQLRDLRSILHASAREPGCLGTLGEIRRSIQSIEQQVADGDLARVRGALTDLVNALATATSRMERARVAVEQAADRVSGSGISATIARTWNFIAVETFRIDKLTIKPLTVKISILSLAGATIYFNIGEITNFVLSSAQRTAVSSVAEPDLSRIAKEIAGLKEGTEAERKAIADAYSRLEFAIKSGKPEARKSAIEILLKAVNNVSGQAAQNIASIVGDVNARLATFEGGVHITNITGSDPAVRDALGRIETILKGRQGSGAEKPFNEDEFIAKIIAILRKEGNAVINPGDPVGVLLGDVTFQRNTAKVKPEARAAIKFAARELGRRNSGDTVFVLGHADEIHFKEAPARIEQEIRINERLSSDRAHAVAGLMTDVAPSLQVYYLGLGSALPIRENLAGSGNPVNRRVDFLLCKTYSECEAKLRGARPGVLPHYPTSTTSYTPRRVGGP